MLFIVKYKVRSENRNAAMERFLESGGKVPTGIKLLGRWHTVAQLSGFAVIEASDAESIQQWVMEWNDILSMKAFPALTDEQIAPMMMAVLAKKSAITK
ncbi:DUF3303 domain-containing protein [Acinetobacter sp. GXMZU3951]|jgi:hypothetical protein